MALGDIGIAPVQNTNDGSVPCNVLNQYWNAAIRDVQRSCPWDFNTVWITLAQNTTYQIINNWGFAYTYPATAQAQPECLKIWKILSPVTGAQIIGTFPGIYPNTSVSSWSGFNMRSAKYQVVWDSINLNKVILTNVNQSIAEYATPIFDPTQFDGVFVEAVTLKLAALVCPSLVNDDAKLMNVVKLYTMKISDAMRMNSEEGNSNHNAEQSAFLDSRGGGGPVSPSFWNSPSTSQY